MFRLFFEDSHQAPKGYFQRTLQADVHMHTATSDPQALTHEVVEPLFTDMWGGMPKEPDHVNVTEATIPCFVSPYSASVLWCGLPSCPVRFNMNGHDPESIRAVHAAHLAQVYAIEVKVVNNANGLPENTGRLEAPTTSHVTLHSSISKSWRALDRDARLAVLEEVVPNTPVDAAKPHMAAFIAAIVDHICLVSARGNIYNKILRDKVVWVLPSFFVALHTVAQMKQLDDADLELVENLLAARIEWEAALSKM